MCDAWIAWAFEAFSSKHGSIDRLVLLSEDFWVCVLRTTSTTFFIIHCDVTCGVTSDVISDK